MDEHELPPSDTTWDPYCLHVSQREGLVAATIDLVLEKGVVVIRATPQVGKSTLLKLLGLHILDKHPALEPIWLQWQSRKERDGLPYANYLDNEAMHWRRINSQRRPHNPNAKKIFLIDEAQNSYREADFWSYLKNRFTRSHPFFVLVCVYGSTTNFLAEWSRDTQSEATKIDQSQRIELRPPIPGGLCMQFNPKETGDVVQKWASDNKFKLVGNVCEYMHLATSGHPGMLGLILTSFESCFSQVKHSIIILKDRPSLTIFPQLNSEVRLSRAWTPELCHAIITNQASFMDELEKRGRGVWTVDAEYFCLKALSKKEYDGIEFPDIVEVMQQVATKRTGYTRLQTDFDAFAFCHKMGFLHTEPSSGPDQRVITYVFASPIHQRYTMTIPKMMMMLTAILELRTGASYQVPTQTQHLMTARSCRYA